MSGALWWPWGGGQFIVRVVPLYLDESHLDGVLGRVDLHVRLVLAQFFVDNLLVQIHFIIGRLITGGR